MVEFRCGYVKHWSYVEVFVVLLLGVVIDVVGYMIAVVVVHLLELCLSG